MMIRPRIVMCFLGSLLLKQLVTALDPSFPDPLTGTPNCLNPIGQVICTVDTRTGFVAGMEYGRGPQYGTRSVCSRGTKTLIPSNAQTSWDMTDVDDPSFPKNATQQPNLEYFFPLGGLITQMIVLEASNPLGPTFGEIPAVIFRYYTPETSEIGMATCGNAIYANAYLYPGSRPPPTPVSLRSVFVNPLSAKTPAFLSTFQATCSPKGGGYMGGDPYTSSKYHVLSIFKACFAPVANIVNIIPPIPEEQPDVSYNWTIPHSQCYYDKHNAKRSTSFSCAASGQSIATGKYSAIYIDSTDQTPYENARTADGKFVRQKWSGEVYEGSRPSSSLAA